MKKLIILLLSLGSICAAYGAVLPTPSHVRPADGSYKIGPEVKIWLADSVGTLPQEYLARFYGAFRFCQTADSAAADLRISQKEGTRGSYTLDIRPDGVTIEASGREGVMNGMATMRQLLPPVLPPAPVELAAQSVTDSPRYPWRGLMLDCSRHFFTVPELEETLDLMSLLKLNTFHWHLTDNQGWRAEIKRYPELTSRAGWRHLEKIDRVCLATARRDDNPDLLMPSDSRVRTDAKGDTIYGGYYNQDEMRHIVAYAAERGIQVMPEIDVPGHSWALTRVFPEITCSNRTSSTICPGCDTTITVLQNIFSEIFDIFPCEYIHIGGDEVDKTPWHACLKCQRRVADKDLESAEELQAWFVRRMELFFRNHGRRLTGWDEIAYDGIGAETAVVWWRGDRHDVLREAAAGRKHLIGTMSDFFYLNFDYNDDQTQAILSFDYDTSALTEAQKRSIRGIQANLWGEYVPTQRRAHHQLFPRLFAVAERAWRDSPAQSGPDTVAIAEFWQNTDNLYCLLDGLGVNYCLPEIRGVEEENVFVGSTVPRPTMHGSHGVIRYTTDGTIPTAASPLATGIPAVDGPARFIFASFRPDGTRSQVLRANFRPLAGYMPAVDARLKGDGLVLAQYRNVTPDSCARITDQPLLEEYVVASPSMPKVLKDRAFVFRGYVDVPVDGIYTFGMTSDSGSTLTIDGKLIVDNDGHHVARLRRGQAALAKGLHQVEFRYFVSGDHSGNFIVSTPPELKYRH